MFRLCCSKDEGLHLVQKGLQGVDPPGISSFILDDFTFPLQPLFMLPSWKS